MVKQFLDYKEVNNESGMTSEDDMSIVSQGNQTAQDNLPHQSVSTAIDNGLSTQQNRTTGKYNLHQSVHHRKK